MLVTYTGKHSILMDLAKVYHAVSIQFGDYITVVFTNRVFAVNFSRLAQTQGFEVLPMEYVGKKYQVRTRVL